MPLKIESPWYPTALRGNYLYWKNANTGETRKTYISEGQLAGIKKDLEKYRKLTSGLGYPWVPVRYEEPYIIYKSSASGLETKSFVPVGMRADVEKFLKPSLGEPGKAKVLDLQSVGKGKYAYIDRGNFTMLREAMTARDRALSGFNPNPYTIRTGVVTKVLEGNRIIVDGVIVQLRNTDTPNYRQDAVGWQKAKDYTENLTLGKTVTLTILINQPRADNGDTLADVTVASEDVAGKIMLDGHAPIKSAVPQGDAPITGLEWFAAPMYALWASTENFATYLDSSGKTPEDNKFMLWLNKQSAYYNPNRPQYKFLGGTWGAKGITDRRTPSKIQREQDLKDDAKLNRTPSDGEKSRRERQYLMMDVVGDPMMWGNIVFAPFRYVLKPGYVKFAEYLNKFEPPPAVYESGFGWVRAKRLFRQTMTLYNPVYHIGNFIGDSFNAFLGGLRNPKRIAEAHALLTLPPTVDGAKVVFTSIKGRPYTIAELRVFEEEYRFGKIGIAGQTTAEGIKKVDIFDKLFAPGQKLSEFENARMRYASFLDRLKKGDTPEQAYAHAKRFLIDYDKISLTNFERTWLEPNIPFYMWMRQNTILQGSQIQSQPQTYAVISKLAQPMRPTPEEQVRFRDYQQNQILIRNPFDPKTFIRIRLPIEDLALFDTRLSTPEKAALLLYPHISAVLELMTDRNFFDNSRPSKSYPLYITKKFSGGWYWKYRDFVTLETSEAVTKQFGMGAIEPGKDEYMVGKLLMDAGMAKTYDQMKFEREEKIRKDKAEASAFVQTLMQSQAELPPSMRDRPSEFGGLDWLGFPLYGLQAETINFMQLLREGKWGSMSYRDKIGAGNIFRRLYEQKTVPWRERRNRAIGITSEDDLGIIRGRDYAAGFLIELGGNIAGDPISYVGYGRGLLTKVFQVGKREFPLTHAGEQLYITLRRTRGEYEAKWLVIQAAKKNSAKYIQKEGLRILGTNWELITQPTMQAITSPIWKGLVHYPIIQPIKYGFQGISSVVKIIRDKLPLAKPIDYSAFNYILRDLRNEARSQMQSKKAELYALQMEAKAMFGKGYDTFVQMLIEDEAMRAQYPIFKPLVESILQRNANIASIEMAWKLLDTTRSNYLLHAMTPMAREAMESGKLLLPPKSLSASGDRNVIQIMGEIINPYNIGRVYGETIEQINTWSVKAQGFPLLEEGAFNIMKIREGMHVRSVAVMSKLKEVAETFGEPLGLKIPDYAISKIPQLQGVQLPIKIIKMLEDDEIIRSQIAELSRKSKLEQMLWYSDTAQRVWRFSVTFGDPSWLPNNVQSGLYVAWMYAHINRISSYKNAWTELARRSEVLNRVFKLSQEGGVIKNVYNEAIPASQLIAEAKEAGILGVEGAADISRNYQFGLSDTLFTKIQKAASWALKNSEDIIRFPMYYDLRINKGMSVEEARSIVMHTQGNYGKSALSPFESQVMTRLTNFYVWYKLAPKVLATQFITEPRTLTIPYHLVNAWNGDRGDTERQYLTDIQLTRMIFRIPGTDAYTTPAIFSLSNAVYKMGYLIKDRERGFYWEELNRDPDLLLRFLKDETAVDWLNRGAGRVTVEANKATITYVETGDSVSVRLDSGRNKLVLMDDMTGATIKEFPIENTDGKFGIYKEVTMTDTIEKVVAEYGARTLVMPIELALQKDFRFTSVIDSPFTWAIDQFIGTMKRASKEIRDPTIDWREKIADLVIGWYINHLRDNPMIPRQDLTEEAVNKVIGIKIWEVERGDYLGCGA